MAGGTSMDREVVKIADLKAAPYNPRRISKEAADGLTKSLERWGVVQEVVANKRTGHIVGGHQRVAALRKMGVKEVPVVWVDLDDVEEKALNVALNNPHISGEFDDTITGLLAEIRDGIGPEDFAELKLDELLPPDAEVVEGKTDPDDVPDVSEEPITKPGDLWILGNHRLMCGDSTNIQHVERLMGGEKADICFTSPPYNAGSLNVKGDKGTGKKYNSFDDNQSETEFFDFLTANMNCMLASAGEIFYNIGLVQDNKRTIFKMVDHFGDVFKDIIYWKKKSVAPHIQKGVINNLVEFILCFGDGKRKFANPQFGQGTYFNVIEGGNASGNEYSDIHKATFPVYLPENIITNFTCRNAIVIDCFGGTTIIACEKTSRQCRMMELDPVYCDVIVKRWEEFTGKKAVLEASDATG
jgi:DNA modification methylase